MSGGAAPLTRSRAAALRERLERGPRTAAGATPSRPLPLGLDGRASRSRGAGRSDRARSRRDGSELEAEGRSVDEVAFEAGVAEAESGARRDRAEIRAVSAWRPPRTRAGRSDNSSALPAVPPPGPSPSPSPSASPSPAPSPSPSASPSPAPSPLSVSGTPRSVALSTPSPSPPGASRTPLGTLRVAPTDTPMTIVASCPGASERSACRSAAFAGRRRASREAEAGPGSLRGSSPAFACRPLAPTPSSSTPACARAGHATARVFRSARVLRFTPPHGDAWGARAGPEGVDEAPGDGACGNDGVLGVPAGEPAFAALAGRERAAPWGTAVGRPPLPLSAAASASASPTASASPAAYVSSAAFASPLRLPLPLSLPPRPPSPPPPPAPSLSFTPQPTAASSLSLPFGRWRSTSPVAGEPSVCSGAASLVADSPVGVALRAGAKSATGGRAFVAGGGGRGTRGCDSDAPSELGDESTPRADDDARGDSSASFQASLQASPASSSPGSASPGSPRGGPGSRRACRACGEGFVSTRGDEIWTSGAGACDFCGRALEGPPPARLCGGALPETLSSGPAGGRVPETSSSALPDAPLRGAFLSCFPDPSPTEVSSSSPPELPCLDAAPPLAPGRAVAPAPAARPGIKHPLPSPAAGRAAKAPRREAPGSAPTLRADVLERRGPARPSSPCGVVAGHPGHPASPASPSLPAPPPSGASLPATPPSPPPLGVETRARSEARRVLLGASRAVQGGAEPRSGPSLGAAPALEQDDAQPLATPTRGPGRRGARRGGASVRASGRSAPPEGRTPRSADATPPPRACSRIDGLGAEDAKTLDLDEAALCSAGKGGGEAAAGGGGGGGGSSAASVAAAATLAADRRVTRRASRAASAGRLTPPDVPSLSCSHGSPDSVLLQIGAPPGDEEAPLQSPLSPLRPSAERDPRAGGCARRRSSRGASAAVPTTSHAEALQGGRARRASAGALAGWGRDPGAFARAPLTLSAAALAGEPLLGCGADSLSGEKRLGCGAGSFPGEPRLGCGAVVAAASLSAGSVYHAGSGRARGSGATHSPAAAAAAAAAAMLPHLSYASISALAPAALSPSPAGSLGVHASPFLPLSLSSAQGTPQATPGSGWSVKIGVRRSESLEEGRRSFPAILGPDPEEEYSEARS